MFTWIYEHIGLDKLKHFFACLAIAFMGSLITLLFEAPMEAVVFAGAYASIGAALCKEVADWMWGGEFGLADLLADIIGCAVGVGIAVLVSIG